MIISKLFDGDCGNLNHDVSHMQTCKCTSVNMVRVQVRIFSNILTVNLPWFYIVAFGLYVHAYLLQNGSFCRNRDMIEIHDYMQQSWCLKICNGSASV